LLTIIVPKTTYMQTIILIFLSKYANHRHFQLFWKLMLNKFYLLYNHYHSFTAHVSILFVTILDKTKSHNGPLSNTKIKLSPKTIFSLISLLKVLGSTELAWDVTAYIDIRGPNRKLQFPIRSFNSSNYFDICYIIESYNSCLKGLLADEFKVS